MFHPVVIENEYLLLEVWPQYGGKVSSVIDKADGYELMFGYPAELPDSPHYDIPYSRGWYAGWDECFPAIAPCRYVGHPYDGVSVPDHGELWGIPTTAVPTKDGITTVWQGLRFGYRLTRKLHLDGASLIAEYTLINLAPFPLRYIWAMHALLNMTQPLQLQPPVPRRYSLRHDSTGSEQPRTPFDWPVAPTGLDFSQLQSLPVRSGWKLFSTDAIASPFAVYFHERRRRLSIEFAAEELKAYWGIWINTGGWNGHRHIAVEPTIGRFDDLDRAVQDGSAGLIESQGRQDWSVRWSVGSA